jgi:DNA-binding response OmpR family regulator
LTSQNENSDGKRRILVVDDDPDTTLAVKMALEEWPISSRHIQ